MVQRDPYSILGLYPSANEEEIREAYLRMARLIHPDRFDPVKQPREWHDANEVFRAINEAYMLLRDPVRRADFDRGRSANTAQTSTRDRTESSQANRQQTRPVTNESAPPSHGRAFFSTLPSAVQSRIIERQEDRIKEQTWVETERTGGYIGRIIIFSLWFVFLAFGALDGQWKQETYLWTLIVSLLVGLLIGWQIDWLIRKSRSPLRPRLYVTALYLLETSFNEVKWWPIWSLEDLKVIHHYRNGGYEYTALDLFFPDSTMSYAISPLPNVERLLAMLRSYDTAARKAAASNQWDYFVVNDDFRNVSRTIDNDGKKNLKRWKGYAVGTIIALVSYAIIIQINLTQPSYKGIPHSENQSIGTEKRNVDSATLKGVPPASPIETFAESARLNENIGRESNLRDSSGVTVFSESPQPLPRNGQVRRYARDQVAPLKICTKDGEYHYFIKLVDSNSDTTILTVFVRGGDSVSLRVPLGTMKLRYAIGSTWYGEQYLFGPDTEYSEADAQFDFQTQGDRVSGYTVELVPQLNGNLREKRIRPNQW